MDYKIIIYSEKFGYRFLTFLKTKFDSFEVFKIPVILKRFFRWFLLSLIDLLLCFHLLLLLLDFFLQSLGSLELLLSKQ